MAEKAEIVLSAKDQTAAAFANAQRGLSQFRASAVSAGAAAAGGFAALAAAATTVAVALGRLNPRPIIDYADSLNDLSERTGLAIETLSGYQYAAKLADVSVEELSAGLKKLNLNIAAAARGEREQAEAFRAIGVSVVDASGKVRAADAVFEDLADRFATYEDGANKVALANAVGGKSFSQLITLLNTGSSGIRKAREELASLGGVITADLARKSGEFNDNLDKLAVAADGLKVAIASGLIDSLVKYSAEAVQAAQTTGLLAFSLDKLKALFSGQTTREFAFGKALPPDQLKEAQREVETLTDKIKELQFYLERQPKNQGVITQLDALTKSLDAAKARVAAASGGPDAFRQFRVGEIAQSDFSGAPKPKTAAPALRASGAADDGSALLRKQLEGRLKAIADAQEQERDLFQFAETRLAEQYQSGELSITQFYDAKNRAQLDALAEQQKGFDAEIAALREYQAKVTKPQEKQDTANKINDVLARQSKAYREAGQAAEVAETQRVRATEAFQRSLQILDAQLAELSGDRFNAELIRNAQALDEARSQLAKGGGDDARVQSLGRLLQLQADLNRAQEASQAINAKAQVAEESYLLAAEAAGLGLTAVEQGVRDIRQQALVQLAEQVLKTQELADASADPKIQQFASDLALQYQRALREVDPLLNRLRDASAEAGATVADGFANALLTGEKLSVTLKKLAADLVRIATSELFTKQTSSGFAALFNSAVAAYMNSDSGFATNQTGTSLPTSGGRAIGGSVSRRKAYLVGESGPEVLLMGGQGGMVMPNEARAWENTAATAQPAGAQVYLNIQGGPSNPKVQQRQQGGKVTIDVIYEPIRDRLMGEVNNGGPFMSGLSAQTGLSRTSGLVR